MKIRGPLSFVLAGLLVLLFTAQAWAAPIRWHGSWGVAPTTATYTEHVDGRMFLLHKASRTYPRPLVVMLHGLNQTAAQAEQETALDAFSDIQGFTVAYPQALPGKTGIPAWNAGGCCDNQTANDLQFIKDVVTATEHLTPIDPKRVYVWGFSNGGMMALREICQTNGVFAAAASQSGPYLGSTCNRPIWRHLHGDPDLIVPPHGGIGTFPSYNWADYSFPDSTQEPARFGGFVSFQLVPGGSHQWLVPSNNSSGIDSTSDFWDHTSLFSL